LALGGSKEQEVEYGQLKGKYEAIQQVIDSKNCPLITPQERMVQTTPICTNEKECAIKWEAAQIWVVHNSAYKIQTTTNVLLETYNSPNGESKLAVRVTKEPLGGGRYKFIVNAWCGSELGCIPDELSAGLDFNKQISAIAP